MSSKYSYSATQLLSALSVQRQESARTGTLETLLDRCRRLEGKDGTFEHGAEAD